MANTGYKGWTMLEKYYTDNGLATGATKSNAMDDTDYISPVYDLSSCPLPAGNTYCNCNPTDGTPDFGSQTFSFSISSDYNSYVLSSDVSWLSVVNGPTGYNGSVTLRVLKNLAGERYGNILIKSSGITIATFSVIQGGM